MQNFTNIPPGIHAIFVRYVLYTLLIFIVLLPFFVGVVIGEHRGHREQGLM